MLLSWHYILSEPTKGRALYSRYQQLDACMFSQEEPGVKRSSGAKRVEVQLEHMQLADIEAVLAIEQQAFTMPWTDAMFRSELQNKRTSHMLVARVAQDHCPVVGY